MSAAALAHAKSSDAAILSGYMGKSEEWDDAIVKFSKVYAGQNDKDFKTFKQAVKKGILPVADE